MARLVEEIAELDVCACVRACVRACVCVRARARVYARTLRVQPLAQQQPSEECAVDRVHRVDDRRLGRTHPLLAVSLQQVGRRRHRH